MLIATELPGNFPHHVLQPLQRGLYLGPSILLADRCPDILCTTSRLLVAFGAPPLGGRASVSVLVKVTCLAGTDRAGPTTWVFVVLWVLRFFRFDCLESRGGDCDWDWSTVCSECGGEELLGWLGSEWDSLSVGVNSPSAGKERFGLNGGGGIWRLKSLSFRDLTRLGSSSLMDSTFVGPRRSALFFGRARSVCGEVSLLDCFRVACDVSILSGEGSLDRDRDAWNDLVGV